VFFLVFSGFFIRGKLSVFELKLRGRGASRRSCFISCSILLGDGVVHKERKEEGIAS